MRAGTTGVAPSSTSTPVHEIHMFGEVLCVAADAGEQARLEGVHPVEAQEVEPRHLERMAYR